MYFQQIISYGNAWNNLIKNYSQEFDDIRAAVAELTPENILAAKPIRDHSWMQEPGITTFRISGCWASSIQARGWEESKADVPDPGNRSIHLRRLGFIKNRVSVELHRQRELLHRWLYIFAPFATRNDFIEIPVGVCLMQQTEYALQGRNTSDPSIAFMPTMFESIKRELLDLSPLSHGCPFLLIGISLDEHELEVIELESEGDSVSRQIIINRSIEFPPEYH